MLYSWEWVGCRMVESNWFGRIFYEGKRDRLPGIDTYPKMFSTAYVEGREQLLAKTMLSAKIESKVRWRSVAVTLEALHDDMMHFGTLFPRLAFWQHGDRGMGQQYSRTRRWR
mmetsp:Transcript_10993/g.40307  ORF Transcript_10993/g.40307 Transcript_10993/m.40307 type:complete len:113 (+) Transcript_10993:1223-1561(+)